MRALLFLVFMSMAVPSSVKAEVLTWNCSFDKRVDEDGVATERMLLIFKVDTVSQKAYMEGNVGIVEVDFVLGDEAFSFVQNCRLWRGPDNDDNQRWCCRSLSKHRAFW